jgi:hypothetical protein
MSGSLMTRLESSRAVNLLMRLMSIDVKSFNVTIDK